MMATIRTSATFLVVFAGVLPAADSGLVSLVMPDATVIAGVNVTQATTSPFGQYVLALADPSNQQLQALTALTGFDPRKDVSEFLAATNGGKGSQARLLLARGAFNVGTLTAAATMAGATSQTYKDVAILTSPKIGQGLAFLDPTLAVLGDVASIKGAIDRQAPSSQHLGAGVISQIGQLSAANDAWVLTTVPPASLHAPAATPNINGLNLSALQQVQQATAGVKFGVNVTVTAQAQMDTVQNATALAGMIQFLANMAQMQAQKAPEAAALAKAVGATANGSTVSVTFSLPEEQVQQLLQPRQSGPRSGKTEPKKME
jgi:hypothetical protein